MLLCMYTSTLMTHYRVFIRWSSVQGACFSTFLPSHWWPALGFSSHGQVCRVHASPHVYLRIDDPLYGFRHMIKCGGKFQCRHNLVWRWHPKVGTKMTSLGKVSSFVVPVKLVKKNTLMCAISLTHTTLSTSHNVLNSYYNNQKTWFIYLFCGCYILTSVMSLSIMTHFLLYLEA